MSKISSTASLLNLTASVTVLALAANALYVLESVAQTHTAPSSATSPSGCLSGYPDSIYQGDHPLTRNEFAAGLNACLNQANQLVPINKAESATREDFQLLIDRQIELNRQLQQLSDQIDDPATQKR